MPKKKLFTVIAITLTLVITVITTGAIAWSNNQSTQNNTAITAPTPTTSILVAQTDIPATTTIIPTTLVPTTTLKTATPTVQIPKATSSPNTSNPGQKYTFNKVIGWIASFDYQNGKNSFYKNISIYNEISPVYYDLKADGSLSFRANVGDPDLLQKSHANKVKVVPTIISYDGNAIHSMLNNPTNYNRHIDIIMSEIDKHGYDGIDLDYEVIKLQDKTVFLNMIRDLGAKLHAKNKILAVTVMARDGDYEQYIKDTNTVQDWKSIDAHADEIRIMAYNYTYSSKQVPVAPIKWMETNLQYAKNTGVTMSKVIIGHPLFGYSYGGKKSAHTFAEISTIIRNQKITPTISPEIGEKTFKYTSGSETRTMWYDDHETLREKFRIGAQYGSGGVVFWRLGGEDQNMYTNLGSIR